MTSFRLSRPAFGSCLAALIATALLIGSGCESAPKTGPGNEVMAPAAGGTVEVGRGDVLRVDLKSNRTTGYRWQVDELPSGMAVEDEAIYAPDADGRPGAGGVEQWRFAVGPKATGGTLRMRYGRPWEGPDSPGLTWSVQVRVVP
jgi:predicted secreted protein